MTHDVECCGETMQTTNHRREDLLTWSIEYECMECGNKVSATVCSDDATTDGAGTVAYACTKLINALRDLEDVED